MALALEGEHRYITLHMYVLCLRIKDTWSDSALISLVERR
jgi:hypothetical protein